MTLAATLGALTDELIQVITSTSAQSDPDRLNLLRESSLRKLRQHNFLRTNRFEVDAKLDGFEEHFRVANRDALADALRERLDALVPVSGARTPEILHLLLELEDNPVQKSSLADLKSLKRSDESPGLPLRWDTVAKEEGWDQDRDLWKNVNFGEDSSDEEFVGGTSDLLPESETTSVFSDEARYQKSPADFVVGSHDEDRLDQVLETQRWRHTAAPRDAAAKPQKTVISEFHAVREVLFALNGLENTLFDARGVASLHYQLRHTSWEVCKALLGSFGEAVRRLSVLREFVKQPQNIPLLQVFREAVERRLRTFDREISSLQARYVDIQQDVVVSLAKILDDVRLHVEPLACLSDIIQQLQQSKYPRSFHYLELLFEAAGVAQLEGRGAVYRFIATLFFECFQAYLRSIRLWMEAGELIEGDKTFFISNASSPVSMSQVWTEQFTLRRTPDGMQYVPRFLQPAASKILTTGKSVVVLKLLGRYQSIGFQMSEPPLQVDERLSSPSSAFTPFSEVFNEIFEKWMKSKHHAASATLQQTLFEACGLWSILDTLQHVYLMSDGSRSDTFMFAVFNNLDLLNAKWHDRFNLTAFAHEAFGNLSNVHRISVSVPENYLRHDVADVRRSVRKGLPLLKITCRLSWPIRIVLSDDTLSQYQRAFTFLLQLRRASYVLHKYRSVSDITAGTANFSSEQAVYYGLRSKLLWFCNVLHSYLGTLVVEPLRAQLHAGLQQAEDVAAMIMSHTAFAKRMIDEMCLGSKLEPIQQCVLDVFDLAIRLQDARQLESEREQEEAQELSRLSVMSSPAKSSKRRYVGSDEEEDNTFLLEQDTTTMMLDREKTFSETLYEIRVDFDRHLKFISSGLRGVARASGDSASGKWDTLADMLETGIREHA
ncbi:Spc98 family-domain-containing protein [Durotheca rogersii]|uniref:Spc98 family-domain-containing protein n=1 Tax=Durotheca rogersii TaxID=419775 RepID=UPI00221FD36F|nr:Spc98 family-domain-containing protein [Durotheca rogersii]KAI5862888.1 Spc98 family-domain-containing protein [Durotheca rogersii]